MCCQGSICQIQRHAGIICRGPKLEDAAAHGTKTPPFLDGKTRQGTLDAVDPAFPTDHLNDPQLLLCPPPPQLMGSPAT